MSPELLIRLDVLRAVWGHPIRVSRHSSAVGREDNSRSQHNVRRWGEVRAVDVVPDNVEDAVDAHEFIRYATQLGFTGIGFYANWKQGLGFHLDVRVGRPYGDPAMWGGVRDKKGKQEIVLLAEAISAIGTIV